MTAGTTSPGRGLRTALAVSVALNLAVLGVIGGAWLSHDRSRMGGGPRDLGFGQFTEALTPENRADLRRRFLAQAPGFLAERRAMRAGLQTIITTLRADPFDPAALDAAMAAQAAGLQGRIATGQALLYDFLVDQSPADRRAFADRLEAQLTRKGPERGPRDDPAQPPEQSEP